MSRVPLPESDALALERQALLSRLPTPGAIIAGKYRIAEVLGSGAMGCVMAAEHLLMQRQVAIKFVLGRASNPNSVQRFFREARVTQSLQDEHVVRVYDLGVLENGTPYLVMEYLEGRDLGQVLKSQGKLPAEDAADYALAACQALAEAHASGIVHRDIKPSNLLLTLRRNGTPLLKVVDFGISKLLDEDEDLDASLTGSVSLLGSPLYMSPEQVRSAKAIDERSDVWALGVTLYALLTARAPFQGDGVHGVCAAIVADPPAPFLPSDGVDSALQAVVLGCLVKRPEERTASVTALAAQLAPFASKAGQINAARIEALYAAPHQNISSAWQPELATEVTADAQSAGDAAGSGAHVSGEAETAIASAASPAAEVTLNQGTAQTLSPERTPKPPLGRHRAALAVGVAGCLLAGGFGVQHLLRAAPPQDAALTPGAATSSPEGSGAPGSAASAQQIPAASPEEQAEPAEPAPDAQTQPAAAPPSSKDTPSPRAPSGQRPATKPTTAARAPAPASSAPERSKPKASATDDDGFVIPD